MPQAIIHLQPLINAPAQTNIISSAILTDLALYGSVQLNWAGVTTGGGAATGAVNIEASNDGANWTALSGATITVSTSNSGNGSNIYSFDSGKVTEKYHRINYAAGNVTAGTINCFVMYKG